MSLLKVENLITQLRNGTRIVDDISFGILAGETFALLGESGCGKSMTALSLLRRCTAQALMQRQHFGDLLPHRQHRIQAQRRFLENHRCRAAAHAAHLAFAQTEQFHTIQLHRAARMHHAVRQQAQQRQRSH